MKIKKILSVVALIFMVSMAYASYNISLKDFRLTDANFSYLGGLAWYHSAPGLDKGFQLAQQQNKPIMMYFWAVWCKYCAQFQTDTLGNPQVRQILKDDYVLEAMDLDQDTVARQYGVSYPPYLIFLDPKGNVLERVPGAVGPDYLLPIITKIKDQISKSNSS